MRPLLALLVVTIILGGLQLYMMVRPHAAPLAEIPGLKAAGQISLEITLTFAAGADPFAVDADDSPSLLVVFEGNELLRITESIEPGETIRIDDVPNVTVGINEFYVRASPQHLDESARAIRVRVLRDNHPLTEDSIWSQPGTLVEGTVVVSIESLPETPAEATGDTA